MKRFVNKNFFAAIFFGAVISAHAQNLKEQYAQVYGSVEWAIPQLSGQPLISSGSSFLLDSERGLYVTAYHVIVNIYPALKDDGKYLTVNKVPARFLCGWREADMAIVKAERVPKGMRQAKIGTPKGSAMVYASMGGSMTEIVTLEHSRPGELSTVITRSTTDYRSPIGSVFEGALFDGSSQGVSTGAEFFSMSLPVRTGFSGGPLMNEQGEVVGISMSVAQGTSYASSVTNIATLKKKCKL